MSPGECAGKEYLRIAAVQLEISGATYRSVNSFRRKINSIVGRLFKDNHYDLVIFPEYTSVFVALVPYRMEIEGEKDFRTAFKDLKARRSYLASIKELFMEESGFVKSVMDNVFGALSKRYKTFILGGTYFARCRGRNGGDILSNRAVVYGPDGDVCYTQDKVFLTDFERGIVGLSPGKLGKAVGFVVKGRRIGLTICRDTFEEVWSKRYNGYDVWVDIKANGVHFDEREKRNFMDALPARLRECNVRYGITVCLVGRFLDLFWEGESSIIERRNGRVLFLKVVDNFKRERVITSVLNF